MLSQFPILSLWALSERICRNLGISPRFAANVNAKRRVVQSLEFRRCVGKLFRERRAKANVSASPLEAERHSDTSLQNAVDQLGKPPVSNGNVDVEGNESNVSRSRRRGGEREEMKKNEKEQEKDNEKEREEGVSLGASSTAITGVIPMGEASRVARRAK